ncbi:hypothetical protein KGQ74_03370 [Patescibacteria group bacterium]|nr:hypothetical protein [Patescibacteria group bacterium]
MEFVQLFCEMLKFRKKIQKIQRKSLDEQIKEKMAADREREQRTVYPRQRREIKLL